MGETGARGRWRSGCSPIRSLVYLSLTWFTDTSLGASSVLTRGRRMTFAFKESVLKKDLFTYVFMAVLGLRCCVGFLQWWRLGTPLWLWFAGFSLCGARGLSVCSTWAQEVRLPGSRAQMRWWWCTGLAALRHMGYSETRDRTRVAPQCQVDSPHSATREGQGSVLWGGQILQSHQVMRDPFVWSPQRE